MSAPERIWIDGAVNANTWAEQKTDCTLSGVAAYEYVRADLCDPQDERVTQLVDVAIAEDTAVNKRVTSRKRKQYIRGRIEALKDLRAALRALEQGEG